MITYTYTIKTVADATNPNEQTPGLTIVDDRLYDTDVLYIVYGENVVAAPPAISKPLKSNTLSLQYSSSVNDIYQVVTQKTCTCE